MAKHRRWMESERGRPRRIASGPRRRSFRTPASEVERFGNTASFEARAAKGAIGPRFVWRFWRTTLRLVDPAGLASWATGVRAGGASGGVAAVRVGRKGPWKRPEADQFPGPAQAVLIRRASRRRSCGFGRGGVRQPPSLACAWPLPRADATIGWSSRPLRMRLSVLAATACLGAVK